jgi:hypothetical protein
MLVQYTKLLARNHIHDPSIAGQQRRGGEPTRSWSAPPPPIATPLFTHVGCMDGIFIVSSPSCINVLNQRAHDQQALFSVYIYCIWLMISKHCFQFIYIAFIYLLQYLFIRIFHHVLSCRGRWNRAREPLLLVGCRQCRVL